MAATNWKPASFSEPRAFTCQQCGGGLNLRNARTRYVVCPYCGTQADATTDDFKILHQFSSPSSYPPRSFIKLGDEAIFDGVRYSVIARTVWYSDYMELESDEDGNKDYESNVWQYDEWLLLSDHRTFRFLIEDQEGFHWVQEYYPRYPSLMRSGRSVHDFVTGQSVEVQEYGKSVVKFFEGESTYEVTPGDEIFFEAYRKGSVLYTTELRQDGHGQPTEIEFFAEEKVSKIDIATGFSAANDPEALEMLGKANRTLERLSFWTKALAGTAALAIILALVRGGGNPTPIADQRFSFQRSDSIMAATEELRLLGKIANIPLEANTVVDINIAASLQELDGNVNGMNRELSNGSSVFLEWQNEKGEVISANTGEIYNSKEYDSEDGTVEFSSNSSESFERKVSTTGKYHLLVYATLPDVGDATYHVTIRKTVLSRFYWIFGVLTGIVAIILWASYYSYKKR